MHFHDGDRAWLSHSADVKHSATQVMPANHKQHTANLWWHLCHLMRHCIRTFSFLLYDWIFQSSFSFRTSKIVAPSCRIGFVRSRAQISLTVSPRPCAVGCARGGTTKPYVEPVFQRLTLSVRHSCVFRSTDSCVLEAHRLDLWERRPM